MIEQHNIDELERTCSDEFGMLTYKESTLIKHIELNGEIVCMHIPAPNDQGFVP